MIPLNMTKPGQKVEILSVRAGRGLAMRLANMGFYPGVVVEIVYNIGRGPIIVAKGGIRLGLGYGMAHKIFVRVLPELSGDKV